MKRAVLLMLKKQNKKAPHQNSPLAALNIFYIFQIFYNRHTAPDRHTQLIQ
jgi:hypothetical protein